MTYFIGIDPSATCTGVCIVDENGQVLAAHAIKRDDEGGLWQRGLACDLHAALDIALSRTRQASVQFVLEHQEWRGSKREKSPASVLVLQEACGIAIGVVSVQFPQSRIRLVKPSEWKGQVDKETHHRIELLPKWQAAAKAPGVALPKAKGPAADVLDAYGLAEFGRERARLEGIIREKCA